MASLSPHPSAPAAMPPSPRSPVHNTGSTKRPSLRKLHSSQSAGGNNSGSNGSGADLAVMHQRHEQQAQQQQQQQQYHHHSAHPSQQHLHPTQPSRHHTKSGKHAKIVLPRNLSSARNLAKLARQQLAVEDARMQPGPHLRHFSRDATPELRRSSSSNSPSGGGRGSGGSGGDDVGATRPSGMRRNLTSSQLPRNAANAKLKKNLSHGQLGRLAGSNRNLIALATVANNAANAPVAQVKPASASPGARGKTKRARSDGAVMEKDLHQQEVELAEQMRAEPARVPERKKIGFAVGSAGDVSDEDDSPEMEGSGLQEDEWEDQSGSASPETTRQNTANNSRRPSAEPDIPPDRRMLLDARNRARLAAYTLPVGKQYQSSIQSGADQQKSLDQDKDDDDDDDEGEGGGEEEEEEEGEGDERSDDNLATPLAGPKTRENQDKVAEEKAQEAFALTPASARPTAARTISTASSREHSNPATKHLLDRSTTSTAPALVSNVSTLDDIHSSKASSATASTVSSSTTTNNNMVDSSAEQHQDELVSHFIPSTSHPSTDGTGTAAATPKTTSDAAFSAPEMDKMDGILGAHRPAKSSASQFRGPTSPGSTISGSSGAATPALSMSRTELRLKNEKFMADMEEAAAHNPPFPAHKFDRRNESLKSYLNLAAAQQGAVVPSGNLYTAAGLTLGPEIFQGRFKAVNTELKVVQQFHNPLAGSIARLQKCKDSAVSRRRMGSSQQQHQQQHHHQQQHQQQQQQHQHQQQHQQQQQQQQQQGQQQRGKAPPTGSKAVVAIGGRATVGQSTASETVRPAVNGATTPGGLGTATATATATPPQPPQPPPPSTTTTKTTTSDRRGTGRVKFSQDVIDHESDDGPETGGHDDSTPHSRSPEAIARRMWDSIGGIAVK